MIKLTITEKGGEPKALTFDKDEISIGRVSGNDIVLPKGNVSKRHSKIVHREGHVEVADLKSTNGTYVNGRKIAEAIAITAADKIYVGDFMIVLDGETAGASAGNGQSDPMVSASRRLPIPPPPPLPTGRTGSNLSRLPDSDDGGGAGADEEDESLGLAVRPPRAGRMPPPPPPPRRTPIGSVADISEEGRDMHGDMPPTPSEIEAGSEETGAHGGPALFEHSPTRQAGIDDDDEGGFRESPITANRPPGALLAAMSSPEPSSRAAIPISRAHAAEAPSVDRSSRSGPAVESAVDTRVAEALESLLTDATVSAIVINGPETTLVERNGKLEPFTPALGDANALADVLWRLATTALPPPAPDNPVVDVRLIDGTRMAAVFPPAAPGGVCAVIRKPALPERSLADLNPQSPTPSEIQVLLDAAMNGMRNILVTGDAGAVSAVLGALGAAIPADRRVVSVGAGLVRARPGWTELAASSDMAALIRVAAAFRPDHLLVADAGGPEVLEVLMTAARGQEGLVFGLPARSASEAVARVGALAARIDGASGVAQLASTAIDLVVHALSLAGSGGAGVRIAEIAEVKVDARDRLATEPALVWRNEGGRRNGPGGGLEILGVSAPLADALASSGSSLPSNLIRK
jgi:pilus assembly protein CpaF